MPMFDRSAGAHLRRGLRCSCPGRRTEAGQPRACSPPAACAIVKLFAICICEIISCYIHSRAHARLVALATRHLHLSSESSDPLLAAIETCRLQYPSFSLCRPTGLRIYFPPYPALRFAACWARLCRAYGAGFSQVRSLSRTKHRTPDSSAPCTMASPSTRANCRSAQLDLMLSLALRASLRRRIRPHRQTPLLDQLHGLRNRNMYRSRCSP